VLDDGGGSGEGTVLAIPHAFGPPFGPGLGLARPVAALVLEHAKERMGIIAVTHGGNHQTQLFLGIEGFLDPEGWMCAEPIKVAAGHQRFGKEPEAPTDITLPEQIEITDWSELGLVGGTARGNGDQVHFRGGLVALQRLTKAVDK